MIKSYPRRPLGPPRSPLMHDNRPVWLEWCCGEGGTSAGIERAGFRVVGVDNDPRVAERYPYTFVLGDLEDDALWARLIEQYEPVVVGGAPPCQDYSALRARTGKRYPRLIEPFRRRAVATGLPYVIENVERARPELIDPIMICGSMFVPEHQATVDGLLMRRHRLFESNVLIEEPAADLCMIGKKAGWWRGFINVHGGGGYRETRRPDGSRDGRGNKATFAEAQQLLGVDWMSQHGMNESIPWRYAEHVARQVATHLGLERAA